MVGPEYHSKTNVLFFGKARTFAITQLRCSNPSYFQEIHSSQNLLKFLLVNQELPYLSLKEIKRD